jgi:hypothetical protein
LVLAQELRKLEPVLSKCWKSQKLPGSVKEVDSARAVFPGYPWILSIRGILGSKRLPRWAATPHKMKLRDLCFIFEVIQEATLSLLMSLSG